MKVWPSFIVALVCMPVFAVQDAAEQAADEDVDSTSDTHVHLFPIVHYRKSDEKTKVKVLDVVVAQGFTRSRKGEKSRTKVLDVPFASLAKVSKDGEGGSKVKLVNVPFFSLVDTEKRADGRFSRQFIKLPIVGSVFRHKRTKDKESFKFLFFEFSKRNKDAGISEEEEEPENRHEPRRHGNRSSV